MLWLAFVIASVSPSNLYAAYGEDVIPSLFKRVHSITEITTEGRYLIGSTYEVILGDKPQNGFCLLSDKLESSTLQGDESSYPVPESLWDENPEHIWQFQFGKNREVYLYSPHKKLGIAEGKSETNISLRDVEWLPWNMESSQNGTFRLRKLHHPNRALGLNWLPENPRFGTYLVSGNLSVDLYLYKMVETGVGFPGSAVKPTEGDNVALFSAGMVVSQGVEGHFMKAADSYLLQNGTLAFDHSFSLWQCKYKDAETFFLEDQKGKGLETLFEDLSEHQAWKVENGYVVTATNPIRYLITDTVGNLRLRTAKDVENEIVHSVSLLPCGDLTCFETLESGLKTLNGSWSALALADLDWTDTYALDVTQISLPVNSLPFLHQPAKNNCLIYVAEDQEEVLPSNWKNVVLCSSEGENRIGGSIKLEDRCAFMIHRPVAYEVGQISYEREIYADNGWETLCLPFDAEIPEGFAGEELREISEEGVLTFAPTRRVHAHVPLIIKNICSSSELKQRTLRLCSDEGIMVQKSEESSNCFLGTYLPITVAGEGNYYFLNSRGTCFVKAAPFSHLSPFRGYVMGDKVMSVQHKDISTGVEIEEFNSLLDHQRDGVYTLDGRCVSSNSSAIKRLPEGVYIVNGKKILK